MNNNIPKLLAGGVTGLVLFLAGFEGYKTTPYYDTGKVLTVCYGYAGKDINPGKVYTKAECDSLLQREIEVKSKAIMQCVDTTLTQNEFNAYMSLSYNIGSANFCGSSLVKLLNQGKHKDACNQIPRWKYVKGKDCAIAANNCSGIVKRREAEKQLCLKG